MRTFAVFALLATASIGLSAEPPQAQTRTALPDIPAFVQRLDALRQAEDIPGLSVAVLKNQAIVLAVGLGYADVERRIPATADTPYNIAAVTKPISAVVALRLVEAGVLELDRPMVDYSDWAGFCTAFSEQPSIFAQGLQCQPPSHTVRHLLSHTAIGTPGTKFSYNPVLYSWPTSSGAVRFWAPACHRLTTRR